MSTMIPPSDLLKHLVEGVRDWRDDTLSRDRNRTQKAVELVNSLMTELVAEEDLTSERARWIQAQLRATYDQVSAIAEARALQNDYDYPADMLANAIAAARMFFWLRTFDGTKTLDGLSRDELLAVVRAEDLNNPDVVRSRVTRSYSAAVWSVLKKIVTDETVNSRHVDGAKQDALQMMAESKTALLRFVS